MTSDTELLQLIRVKGLTTTAAVQESLGLEVAAQRIAALSATGLLGELAGRIRLSPTGRDRLAELIALERAGLDDAALQDAYEAFCIVNADLKSVITAWQMQDGETPNDHADADYDARILERLRAVDALALPVLAALVAHVPRLSRYRTRFDTALDRISAGDTTFVARPIIDSYHTVWFELHEDLLALTGRSRAEEAAAGRAA